VVEFETKVEDVISRAPGVKSFRFSLKQDIDFKAGQFFLATIKVGGQESTKHFSFSNSPTERGYVEFTKRISASEYSKALNGLQPGAWARLKMPLGNFTFVGEYPKIAFLSGGIGITPIRSICKFITDKRLATDTILLYGNNREEDIIFRPDFEQMVRLNENMRVVYTLTAQDIDKQQWPGLTGYIDAQMIKQEITDYLERIFYICGPPKMVESITVILKNKLAVGEDKIRTENFTGY
jgi:ferredoxin-NADP reductase